MNEATMVVEKYSPVVIVVHRPFHKTAAAGSSINSLGNELNRRERERDMEKNIPSLSLSLLRSFTDPSWQEREDDDENTRPSDMLG